MNSEFPLSNHWTLVAHESCSVYVSTKNPDKFAVLDWDEETILTISTKENSFEIHSSMFNLKHKANISNRTITLIHEPDED